MNSSNHSNSKKPTLINVTEALARDIVSQTIAANGSVPLTYHARERMVERGISDKQITKVLSQSTITEGPSRDASGRWSCRFEGYFAGQGLAVVIGFSTRDDGTTCVVVTAFELDNYR